MQQTKGKKENEERIAKHDLRMQGENIYHNENELQIVNKNYKTQPRKKKPLKQTSHKRTSHQMQNISQK
jgi:hypothetical protein